MICAIIQARMGSTRLPGKVLADIEGKTMLARVVGQAQAASLVDRVAVATSIAEADDSIAEACAAIDAPCFRGSEEDVLDRYYGAARAMGADAIIRLTADCPLLDPRVIDRVVGAFQAGSFDYVSNTVDRTYPDGLDVEVFSFQALERAMKEAEWKSEREHVTAYIWKHPERFRTDQVKDVCDRSRFRWTVDQSEDLELVRCVYRLLGNRPVSLESVLEIVANAKDLSLLNAGIECNEGYTKSLAEDDVIAHRGASE